MEKKYHIEVTTLPGSEVELKGEITLEAFEAEREHALNELGENLEIPGFRKGKVPKDVIEKNIPEMALLETMAEHAIMHAYPSMLNEHKIDAIGQPAVQITKIAKGSPLGFVIRTTIMPVLTLPDYKKIAARDSKPVAATVSDEELEAGIKELRKMRAPHKHAEGEEHTEGETHEVKDEDLPPFDEAFVASLGAFKDIEDFKTKMRENMLREKENREHEKNRLRIMESILKDAKIEVPKLLVDAELDKMLFRMKGDIQNVGLGYEEYLKHLGKTEESIREEFRKDADKRVRIELVLHEIAIKENINPEDAKVEEEVERLMKEYAGADRDRVRDYVTMVLTNEMVFKFLEEAR